MKGALSNTATLDYQAVSAKGGLIATFATPELATAWAEEKADLYPGCRIDLVRTSVTRKTIFEQAPLRLAQSA